MELRLDGTLENARRDLSEDLADIVGNLVDNAIDAAAERGRGGWVQLSLARGTAGGLDLCVRDNGRGIPEPGEQVFAPRWTTKGGGRGFGLALVCDKVNRLHGRITAHNNGGAVFSVSIPAPREEEE